MSRARVEDVGSEVAINETKDMKRLILSLLTFVAIGACTQVNNGTATVIPEQAETADTLCFVRLSGLQSQDTTSLKLIIDGEKVGGQFASFPYQKDSRIGLISGIKTGEVIRATWYYQQEGMDDSLTVEFMLKDNKLLQKQSSFNQATGREYLSDTASFNLDFLKQECRVTRFTGR